MSNVVEMGDYMEHIVAYCGTCGATSFEMLLDNEDDGNIIGIRCVNSGGLRPTCSSDIIDLVPVDN